MAGDEAQKQFLRQLGSGPDLKLIRLLLDSGNPNVSARIEIPYADTVEYPLEYYLRSVVEERRDVDLNIVRLLLEKGADPNGHPSAYISPLGLAGRARGEQVELTRILLDAGADPNKLTQRGMPLLYSFINSTALKQTIQLLIERGADVNSVYDRDDETQTPLGLAIRQLLPGVVQVLLDRGANPNQPLNAAGDLPIHYAARAMNYTAIAQLRAAGADINARTPSGLAAIHMATMPEVIAALRTAGADMNAKNAKGDTALTAALASKRSAVMERRIQALIANGADPNTPGRDDEPPLVVAYYSSRPRAMIELMAAGANPNLTADDQPLIFAVMEMFHVELANEGDSSVHVRVIETMLQRGVDPNTRGQDGETLLHHTAMVCTTPEGMQMISALRRRGVDPNAVDGEGMTMLEMAMYGGHNGARLRPLIDQGFDPNFITPAGTAILHRIVAREIDQYWTAEKLARRVRNTVGLPTIDVNLRNTAGETALHIAARRNLYDIIQILLDAGADPSLRKTGDGGAEGPLPVDLATDVRVKSLLGGADYAGKSLGDIQLLERIFTDPQNISVCPVCLAFSERSDGCRYLMGHACKPEERDEELYQKFKSNTYGIQKRDTIEWCTECGRVTNHHKHYSLSRAEGAAPGFAPVDPTRMPAVAGGVVHFVDDCRPSGGGGLEEKFVRFHALINSFARLQASKGTISASRARVATIREAWNAPLTAPDDVKAPYVQLATLLRAPPAAGATEDAVAEWNARVASLKTFGVNLEVFGTETAPGAPAEEAPAPAVPRPEADRDLNPIRHQGGGAGPVAAGAGGGGDPCILVGGPHDDDRPVFQFQHRQPDGSVYVHPQEEWICAPDLAQMIWKRVMDGSCPINPKKCKGFIHPDELVGIFPEELNRDLEELEAARIDPATALDTYRRFFNKARQTGGKRRKTYRKKARNVTGRRQRGGDDMKTGPEIARLLSRKIGDDEYTCLVRPIAF